MYEMRHCSRFEKLDDNKYEILFKLKNLGAYW